MCSLNVTGGICCVPGVCLDLRLGSGTLLHLKSWWDSFYKDRRFLLGALR
jgi:hypothetical protein